MDWGVEPAAPETWVLRARIAVKAAKYLITVRQALPRWTRGLVALMVAVKVATAPLPVDGGIDEFLIVVTAMVLWLRHRELLRVCVAAARLELS